MCRSLKDLIFDPAEHLSTGTFPIENKTFWFLYKDLNMFKQPRVAMRGTALQRQLYSSGPEVNADVVGPRIGLKSICVFLTAK